MEPSDRHRWTNFVTSCTLDESVDHLCHQGSNLSHCRQLPQPPSSIHTVPILQCNNYWPCQDNDEEMGYIDNTQSVNCECGEPKTMAPSSVAGDLMSLAPRKTSPSSQRGQRYVPACGNTLCEGHERKEVQQWIGNNLCLTELGWQYRDERLVPLTTDLPVAPTRVLRIVSCGCKTGCRKTCGCPRAGLYCSPMCSYCNGHICSNIYALAVSQDSDNAS